MFLDLDEDILTFPLIFDLIVLTVLSFVSPVFKPKVSEARNNVDLFFLFFTSTRAPMVGKIVRLMLFSSTLSDFLVDAS